jgi:hypothetical protein
MAVVGLRASGRQVNVVRILAASEHSATAATVLSVAIVALICFLAGLIARKDSSQGSKTGFCRRARL